MPARRPYISNGGNAMITARTCPNILRKFAGRTTPAFMLVAAALLSSGAGCAHDPRFAQKRDHEFADTDYYIKRFEDPGRLESQKPDRVIAEMNIRNGDTIADIGAGSGFFARRFAKAAAPKGMVVAYDVTPGFVEHMRKDAEKRGLHCFRAELIDRNAPKLPEGYFSVIFMSNTYHHILDRISYISQAGNGLKKGGRFVILDYHRHAKNGPPMHLRLSKEEVISEFGRAGYRKLKEGDFLTDQYYLEFTSQ